MSILRYQTPPAWLDAVLADFDGFLQDHASAEKKASGMAVNLISHYPDRRQLVEVMSELAVEELSHFREVIRLLHERGLNPAADTRDAYVAGLRTAIRKGSDHYLIDQLLIAGIIEARGAERFGLIATALAPGKLKNFYDAITRSEARHYETFFELAKCYFSAEQVHQRTEELLDIEARVCAAQSCRGTLH